MSDEVIEAGARAFYEDPDGLTDWRKLASVEPMIAQAYRDSMVRALAAAVPLLLAPLRELHSRERVPGLREFHPDGVCGGVCSDYEFESWPCAEVRLLDRIEARYSGDGEA